MTKEEVETLKQWMDKRFMILWDMKMFPRDVPYLHARQKELDAIDEQYINELTEPTME